MPPELWDHIATFIANKDRMRLGCTGTLLLHLTLDHTHWTAPGARLDRLHQLRVLHGVPAACRAVPVLSRENDRLYRVLRWKCLIHAPYLCELCLAGTDVDDRDLCGVAEFAPQLIVLDLVHTQVKHTHWLLPLDARPDTPEACRDEEDPGQVVPCWAQLRCLSLGCSDAEYVFSRAVGAHVPVLEHLVVAAADVEYYCLDAFPALQALRMDGLQATILGGGNLRHLCALFLTQTNYRQLPSSLRQLRCGVVPGPDDVPCPDWEAVRAGRLPLRQCPHLTELVVLG